MSIDFNGFIKAVDALGGVDIALTEAEINALAPILRQNGTVINGAGTYHLNGNEALEYARLRDIDSDRARTERQRTILLSIFTKFKKMYSTESYSTLLSKGTKFLDQVLARKHRLYKERNNRAGNDLRGISQVARHRGYYTQKQDPADKDKRR